VILQSMRVSIFPFDYLAGRKFHFGSKQQRICIAVAQTIKNRVLSTFLYGLMNAFFEVCNK